jgi:signal recognition particle receptor subunit beta
MFPLFACDAHVVVVVFDLKRTETFDHVPNSLKFFSPTENPCPVILAGNKTDLTPSNNTATIDRSKIHTFVRTHKLPYIETSARDRTSVKRRVEAVPETVLDSSRTATAGELQKMPSLKPTIILGENHRRACSPRTFLNVPVQR